MNLTCKHCGDYLIPDITIHQPERPLGYYGRMRMNFLRQANPMYYNDLLLSETLYDHCLEIEDAACSRMEQLIPELAKTAGATAELKKHDPMKWVGLMNTCKAQAEEIIKAELIYS